MVRGTAPDDALEILPVVAPVAAPVAAPVDAPVDAPVGASLHAVAPVPAGPTRHDTRSAVFTRLIRVAPRDLENLGTWWRRARADRVRFARRLQLSDPERDASGTWHAVGRLRSPWLRRTTNVELTLWPWLGHWTKICLEPRRRVVAGRRYFVTGHRALDELAEQLERGLSGSPRPDAHGRAGSHAWRE